jgi:hypothetical protein
LKKEPESDEVKIWEPIFAIVFTFIAISIFNFNPQWLVIPIIASKRTLPSSPNRVGGGG